jgi:uncharacterized protein (TIGR03435 family)
MQRGFMRNLRLTFTGKAALAIAGISAVAAQTGAQRTGQDLQPTSSQSHKPVNFDAATVRPVAVTDDVRFMGNGAVGVRKGSGVAIPRNVGGPGTEDPGRIHYPFITLKDILKRAWDSYSDIEGTGWLDTQVVAVDATMPTDTTKEQFQEMLRNLVTDKLGLKYHVATRELTGYALVVAKNAPKMKQSADQSDTDWARPSRPTAKGADGFPVLPPVVGKLMVTLRIDDRTRIICQQVTMQMLAETLANRNILKTAVTDSTGLTAKYDFTLTYTGETGLSEQATPRQSGNSAEASEPMPDLFAAVQSQLGLKLEAKKVPVEVLVIDHMEKTPIVN